jgi:large subunit ribosomal protein L21
MISIFESGGKQYLVSAGDKVQVEKLPADEGKTITFDKVLFTSTGSDAKVGTPYLAGASVQAKVLKQGRSKKIHVLKYKAKSKYRRKIGARQAYTEVEITKV